MKNKIMFQNVKNTQKYNQIEHKLGLRSLRCHTTHKIHTRNQNAGAKLGRTFSAVKPQ